MIEPGLELSSRTFHLTPRCLSYGKGWCKGKRSESEVQGARGPPPQALPGCDILGAFYSEKLPGPSRAGRVVVLNTNLYYSSNEQTAGMADPSQQFQWLGDVLSNASRDGEMVSALASSCALPPGIPEGPVSA